MDRVRLTAFFLFSAVFAAGVYVAVSSGALSLTGMATSRLFVVDLYALDCNFSVDAGWNLFSAPCFEDYPSVTYGLSSLYANTTNVTIEILPNGSTNITNTTYLVPLYTSVHTYDSTDPVDYWESFKPGLPGYVIVDLTNLSHERGYFLSMQTDAEYTYNGRVTLPNNVPLYEGWNLVGFPVNDTENERPINISVDTINDTLTNVYRLESGSYQRYNDTTKDFVNFTIFKGYWFSLTDNDTWVIDW
jgi:hypothetical protein